MITSSANKNNILLYEYVNIFNTHVSFSSRCIAYIQKNIVGSDQNNREKTKLKNVQIIQFNHINVFTFGVKFCVYVKIYEIDNKFTINYKREMSNRILVYGLISGSLNIPKCIAYILYENIINTVYENKLIASK